MLSDLIRALEIVRNIMDNDSLSINEVLNEISNRGGVSREEILGKSKKENVIFLREGAYYIYRKKFDLKYKRIAYLTKRKNHATTLHGVKKIKDSFEIYRNKL